MPSLAAALAEEILGVISLTLHEAGPPEPEKAPKGDGQASEAASSRPVPAVSFWKGPQLHAGLCPTQPGDAAVGKQEDQIVQHLRSISSHLPA